MPAAPQVRPAIPRLSARGAVWLAFYGATLAAWVALYAMTVTSGMAGAPAGLWASLCVGAAQASFPALAAMWALMAGAMMLPTFAPALRTFLHLGQTGATRPRDAAALVGGYLAVWLGAALLGAGAQLALTRAGLVAPDGSSLSRVLTAALLLAAGLYQFSVLKAACLAKCRMPLTFFMQHWRPGPGRAALMGLRLGLLCLGCCWALMALAFVGGTMSLVWMGLATLFMTLEKLPDLGRFLTRPTGWALIAAALLSPLAQG
jgi:predicted metal-binding membrane protein